MDRRVVIVGSGFEVRGGVSAVAGVWARSGLLGRWGARYLATHCDGSAARKLGCAARAWLRFARALRVREVSLLHVHLNSDASFWRKALFIAAARMARVPYVLHVHCGGFADFHRLRCGALSRAVVRRVFRGAAAVIALSEAAARELEAIDPRRDIEVIPNPVELPPVAARVAAGAPRVAFLGALTEAKGVFDLLRAWPAVLAAASTARLVLAGAGDEAGVRALARELAIAHSVELPGWIAGAAKVALLREATVFVLPSHREAMPMALLEAMAAGLPVVATPVGAVPAMLGSDRGVLVPVARPSSLANALLELLRDDRRRHALGEAARRHIEENFSAARVVPRVEALWERLGAAPSDGSGAARRGNAHALGRTDYVEGGPGITAGQVAPPS